ncbi:MAG: SIMPL domain-containing protein [Thermoproteota archaeon]|nr:SIMPL domain-containing protein [Thermoproteota archaeon]
MEYFQTKNKVELAIANAAIAILAVVVIVSIEHIFTNVSAQTDMTNNTLFVTGSATNQTKPDKVTVSLGVETTNSTAQAALTANSDLMSNVLDTLKAAGVQENETSTATFSITPNYNYSANTNQGRLIGFTVSNSIQIESSNIESVSKRIDAAVSAGANNVNNIYFSLSNQKSDDMKNSLLKDAIDNAKTKADIAATAAGLKVMGVKSIIVGEAGLSPPVPVYNTDAFKPGAGAISTPIISGQQEISATVSIVYLIG